MPTEDESPEIPVICPVCDTRTAVPFEDVEAAVSRHNAQLHDGDSVAEVDPDVLERLTDMVGKDLGILD